MIFDIHSHILPDVDDGAETEEEALELLQIMSNQGITHVMATPHFYPQEEDLESFKEAVTFAFARLKNAISKKELPSIYLGCEMLYFEGIGNSSSLSELCLNGSKYLLLELTDNCINEKLFEDIIAIKENSKIVPIIAHIERYHKSKNYRKLLKFVLQHNIPTQINACSLMIPEYGKTIKKLIKRNIAYLLATDTHSLDGRPPLLKKALKIITELYGQEQCDLFITNSQSLLKEIVPDGDIYH